jgi:hypothetical protein
MIKVLRKIRDSKWTLVIVQVLGMLAVLEWIAFPALTAPNSLINIVGFVLLLIVVAAIMILVVEATKELDKKEKDES